MHVPWYLWLVGLIVLLFFPVRWVMRRPWTLVAETPGGYDLPPEHWSGMVRGRGRAKEETRVLIRNLRTRATPGHADSPLQPSLSGTACPSSPRSRRWPTTCARPRSTGRSRGSTSPA